MSDILQVILLAFHLDESHGCAGNVHVPICVCMHTCMLLEALSWKIVIEDIATIVKKIGMTFSESMSSEWMM